MAKPNFILPNKPAIKAGSILSYNYTDDLKFAAEPLDFSRNSSATRVNEQGLIEEVGYFGPQLIQNGDFSQESSELVTNGDFATDSDWTKGNDANINDSKAIISSTVGESWVLQSNKLTVGKSYKITLKVDSVTLEGGFAKFALGTGADANTYNITENGVFNFYFSNISFSSNWIQVFTNGDASVTIDNVSVKEVGQDWSLTVTSPNIVQFQTDQVYLKRTVSAANELFQSVFVIGKTYKLTIQANIISEGIAIEGNGNLSRTNLISGANVFYLTPTSALLRIICVNNTTEGYISNISVIEIIGDKPRIDYSDSSTEPSLLLEPQSTNLITYSEDFSQWARQNAGTGSAPIITSNNTISPDGTQNADKVVFNKGAGVSTSDLSIIASSGFTSQTNTTSFYIKADSPQRIVIRNSTNWQLVDVTTKWQRISKTDTGGGIQIGLRDGYGIANIPNTATIYLWGAQAEALSYATSYIPTSGSTATRLGESANNAGGAGVFNSEEGVLYAEIAALANDGTFRNLSISSGSVTNLISLMFTNSNTIRLDFGNQAQFIDYTTNITNMNKIAFSYKLNELKLYVNGVLKGSVTSATMLSNLNTLRFDNTVGDPFYGKTKNIQVFNYALTDEELQTLTT